MVKRFAYTGFLAAAAAVVALSAGLVAAQAQTATPKPAAATPAAGARKAFTPAKTAWGDPDLQGIYTNKDESGIPFERPNQLGGKRLEDVDDGELAELVKERAQQTAARAAGLGGADTGAGPVHWYEHYDAKNSHAWLVIDPVDGRIPPMTPEAQARMASTLPARSSFTEGPWDGPQDFSLWDRCITRGIPGSMLPGAYGNSYQIVQSPGSIAIRYEMIHETRIIPLDGRPHVAPSVRPLMGDARGHFEGKTLVVETTNFSPRNTYRNANSESLKLVERFTPIALNLVEWAVTVDDPKTWSRPWTFAMNLTKDDSQPPYEYACHEGNYGMPNILRGARAGESAPGAGGNTAR